jgi:hypothetical protein
MVTLPSAQHHRRIDRHRAVTTQRSGHALDNGQAEDGDGPERCGHRGHRRRAAASAMPIDPVNAPGEPGNTQIVAPTPRSSAPSAAEATPDVGFDLPSAAIGAAAGTGLLIVVLAAGGLAWGRPMTRRHGAARVSEGGRTPRQRTMRGDR